MFKVSRYIIVLIVLLSISFNQSNNAHHKPLNEQIHENIHKSLLMNQYSEEARPTEELYQYWSLDNNRWENIEKFTYEYNPAKSNYLQPPNLNRTTWWNWCNINGWYQVYYWLYEWNMDGTPYRWTLYDAANNEPLEMNEYSGPFYNNIPSSETRYTHTQAGWGYMMLTNFTFNQDGWPTESIQSSWLNNGWVQEYRNTHLYYSTYLGAGCPETSTYYEWLNQAWSPYWEDRMIYAQNQCGNDYYPYSPYYGWDYYRCNQSRIDYYTWDVNNNSWISSGYDQTNYDPGNCLAHQYTRHYPGGTPGEIWRSWYSTSNGNWPNKINAANDNTDTRMIRAESLYWDGTQWVNSLRGWFSYEGLQMNIDNNEQKPIKFKLIQNYPNPFNPVTTIAYELLNESDINIKIYNSIGNVVKTLVNDFKQEGRYQTTWDGTENNGTKVSGGTYFCQLQAGNFTETKKMVLIK